VCKIRKWTLIITEEHTNILDGIWGQFELNPEHGTAITGSRNVPANPPNDRVVGNPRPIRAADGHAL
jgi:hypothetical protein